MERGGEKSNGKTNKRGTKSRTFLSIKDRKKRISNIAKYWKKQQLAEVKQNLKVAQDTSLKKNLSMNTDDVTDINNPLEVIVDSLPTKGSDTTDVNKLLETTINYVPIDDTITNDATDIKKVSETTVSYVLLADDTGDATIVNKLPVPETTVKNSYNSTDEATQVLNKNTRKLNRYTNNIEENRIMNVNYFINQLKVISNHNDGNFGCTLNNINIVKEIRNGLLSQYVVICDMCNYRTVIHNLDHTNNNDMDINTLAVNGITSIGSGYYHLQEFLLNLNVPCFDKNKFKTIQDTLMEDIEKCAYFLMKQAAEEEKKIAVEQGNVGVDVTPEIMVICDGTWSKRSYRCNYNAPSGAAAIIGKNTNKVLYLGVKNKCCMMCEKGSNPEDHRCFKNWTGPSTGMEAAILVESFRTSEEEMGLRYTRFSRPYMKPVEKIECRNHLLRNVCNKLKDLCSKSANGPVSLRRKVKSKILKMRCSVVKAIKFRKEEAGEHYEKAKKLKIDLENIASHTFGEHGMCKKINYFCEKDKPDDINIVPELIQCGLYEKIKKVFSSLAINSNSLIYDMTSNTVEQFNSIICKFVGGKRINYSKGRQYQGRCFSAVVKHNSGKSCFYNMSKFYSGVSPSSRAIKKFEQERKRRNKNIKRAKRRINFNNNSSDKMYPDMNKEDFENAKIVFLESLIKTEQQINEIEERTRDQADNLEWKEIRRNLLTASNFGVICRRKPTTRCGPLVKSLLSETSIFAPALEWGRENEEKVRKKVETMQHIEIKKCGLFIDKIHPFLGASPDGLIGDQGLVEIKCPYSARNMTILEGIEKKKITIWKTENKWLELNKKHKWYYQIQGQLHITRRMYCLLAVYTEKDMRLETIFRDAIFWEENMFPQLEMFFMHCLLPEIVDSRLARNMEIREPSHILEAIENKSKA
ncbi:hypothetical protein NQ315_008765 [Exocentrus adspersus]|uniref:YqaJ viral recombinase domain-containing protein n=1 Tax=Exocentrus adspersus TaxID=1586481 RepID=A0AAV8VGP8_9CUCU|nr:hypothetical protein NQ315_008765 [Exocentrus adspersus]